MHLLRSIPQSRFGSRDSGFRIDRTELDAFPESRQSINPCGDPNIQEYLDFVMEDNQLEKPRDWETALEL